MKNTITETAKKVITCVRRWLEYVVAEIKSSYSYLKKGEFNKSLPLLTAGVLLVTVILIVIIAAASPSGRKAAEDDILSEGQTFQTVVSGDYEYYIDANRAVIVSYKGWEEKLTVPAELDGLPVLGIGDGAFDGRNVKRVTVSEGIEFIGKAAFSNCTQMVSIDLPDSLTKIGNYCFKGCSGLEYLYIPRNVTELESNSFENCPNLLGFSVDEENEKYISYDGILCVDGLYNNDPDIYVGLSPESIDRSIVRCPETKGGQISLANVNSIYSGAFKDCVDITSVDIQSAMLYGCNINSFAFEGCTKLESIKLDSSVNSIEYGAFASCASLKRIDVSLGNTRYSSVDGVLFSKNFETLICCPAQVELRNNRFINTYLVPLGVVEIAPYAFNMFSGNEVYVSSGVTTIGGYAFSAMADGARCAPLPESVEIIATYAFDVMPEEKSVDMKDIDGVHWVTADGYVFDDVGMLVDENCDGYAGTRGYIAYEDGYMYVRQNGKVGVVDKDGGCVVPAVFDSVNIRKDGSVYATKDGPYSVGYGYNEIYTLNDVGDLLLMEEPPRVDHGENDFTGTCWTTPIWCEEEQKMYVADAPDFWPGEDDLIEFNYSGLTAAEYYSSLKDFLSVEPDDWWDNPPEEQYVVISDGKRVSDRIFEDAGACADGLIAMKKDDKWGYMDKNGEVIFDFRYDGAWTSAFSYSDYSWWDEVSAGNTLPYDASDGYVVLYRMDPYDSGEDQYALYRTDGTKVLDWSNVVLRPVHDGKLWARHDNVWGLLELE